MTDPDHQLQKLRRLLLDTRKLQRTAKYQTERYKFAEKVCKILDEIDDMMGRKAKLDQQSLY